MTILKLNSLLFKKILNRFQIIFILSFLFAGCKLANKVESKNYEPKPNSNFDFGYVQNKSLQTKDPKTGLEIKSSPHIMVDQFGYRPQDSKVVVIADPQQGFNANAQYQPGKVFELRRWQDHQVVDKAEPQQWEQGKVQASSGDRGWWVDFSEFKTPGQYYVYDTKTKQRSHAFLIDQDVYANVLKAAVRVFYYNRSNFAKEPPYADARWTDKASFLGKNQDRAARDVSDKKNRSLAKDLSGGWWDAGDTNKYVTFTSSAIHQLFDAYVRNPEIFTDDFGIPESGNNIPDLIDEIKYEIDWIKKMQQADGGVLLKVGATNYKKFTPKSRDPRPRYYVEACSSSTIVAAGHFARAASIYSQFPSLNTEIPDLTKRAKQAWNWYQQNPKRDDCDNQEVKSGDADRPLETQAGDAVVAAIYLYALTNEQVYHNYIKANYEQTRPFLKGEAFSGYSPHHGDALLFYAQLPKRDQQISKIILAKKISEAKFNKQFYGFDPAQDLYRAYMPDRTFHWGSNSIRASRGSSNYDLIFYNLLPEQATSFQNNALNNLHYFHGVNPLGITYLSNMYDYGAEASVNEVYHEWFTNKTNWDNAIKNSRGPAPGYLVGGPNHKYSGKYALLQNQPVQKMYADWNGGTLNDKAWEISEPAIYYQSAYIKLLSNFVGNK